MTGKVPYLATGVLALVVALLCATFSLAAGLGWSYLLPTGVAVLLISGGLVRSAGDAPGGAVLSGMGAAVCSMALLGGLVELARAIPFREQPGQATMLCVPLLLFAASLLHAGVSLFRWRQKREA